MSSMKLSILVASVLLGTTLAFFQVVVSPPPQHQRHHVGRTMIGMATTDEAKTTTATATPFFAKWEESPEESALKSLETKMANWEATPDEIKAATLGGVTPGGLGGGKTNGGGRGDGFDVGLYIAFPFMILGSLLFAFFPLIMDKIDVSSVGPPPMM